MASQLTEKYRHILETEGPPLDHLLTDVERVFAERVRSRLREGGHVALSAAQLRFLGEVALGGRRVSDMAELLRLTRQAVGQIADALESRGLVTRSPDPSDARARIVLATGAGVALVEDAIDATRAEEERLGREVGHAALRELKRTLGRLERGYGTPS